MGYAPEPEPLPDCRGQKRVNDTIVAFILDQRERGWFPLNGKTVAQLATESSGSVGNRRRQGATRGLFMQLGKLQAYFETSPAVRLLRSPNAPFIVDFLHRQFKLPGRIAIPHAELLSALITYQEDLHESHPGQFTAKADAYLAEWCSRDARWLQRFLDAGCDEPMYQLTPHTEDVFVFLDRALDRDLGFVGTESRLKLIVDTLADLAVGSSDDPKARLAHLRTEAQRIGNEIARIEADGRVSKYEPAQIRERFTTAVSLLRQLQGDFRAVEETFREIVSQVQRRQASGGETRGEILEYALDAEDLLKQEDQGVSFYEFVRLILSPSQTERLEGLIHEVRRLPELAPQQEGLETLRNMVTLLQNEAEKVTRTNQRLSTALRRLLDSRAHAERQRISQLLREIQALAASLAEIAEVESIGISLETELAIDSAFRRGFWTAPARFEQLELTAFEPDDHERLSAFRSLAALHRLDWSEMRERIHQALATEMTPTLGDLLSLHPPEAGVVEVIGYVQIAAEDGHSIDPRQKETVIVPLGGSSGRALLATIPLVTFIPERRNGHAQ